MIKGFISNASGIMLSRILGLVRDILTALILGAGIFSDLFFIAFKMPNLFRRVFAEGAFTQSFLPNFVKSNKKAIFSAEIFLKFLFFISLLTLLVNIFTKEFITIIATGLKDEDMINAINLVRINFFYLILIYMASFIGSLLQYKGHFATTAFSTALLNLSMICALLLANNKTEKEVALYLSCGVVIGGILQLITHIIALYIKNLNKMFFGGIYNFIKGKKADTKNFFINFYHGVFGSSALQISSFMDTWLASFLATGSISYMFYANRIFQLPLAVFAIALSQALFPKIARLLKNNDTQNALLQTKKSFNILFFTLLASCVGGIVLSEPIIWLLFERGNFTQEDTIQCAKVLSAYLIGLLPFGLIKLFALWLYAKMKQKIASKIATIGLVINLILAVILMQFLGAIGLALASSIVGFLQLGLYLKEFGYRKFLGIIESKFIFFTMIFLVVEFFSLEYLKEFFYANLR
ncbi:murein biosynthesis integral membrane protein MurJ [Campylobacter pinnipediorum]|uniref:murein biosynthesis integral membrane protein MurJ n=1 Tax=Campylobacter pinnipediorum TaxID=1965231 RepID=UPI000994EC5B|nr:murein biosynthesis integral membrane protein MurJ [Campylobacter pinnipediorum]AQW80916.1 lipid II flippase [Campylobacter pinnipediorum subsp. pinnipediorum]